MNLAELKKYGDLDDLLYAWILDPPVRKQTDIIAYFKRRKRDRIRESIKRMEEALAPLQQRGATVTVPKGIYEEHIGSIPKAFLKSLYGSPGGWHYFVPLELPDPIRALLPDLPQFTSLKLQLVGNVSVLLGHLHGLAARARYATKLVSSSNRFDTKQYHALTTQIQVAFDDVKSAANTVTGQIAAEFQDYRQDPLLQPSLEMLDALRVAKKPEDLVSLYLSEAFDQSLILATLADRVSQTIP